MNEDDLRPRIEMFRATIAAGQTAMKSAILINGGAAVATLAFVGSLVQHRTLVRSFGVVLPCFALGALFGAVGTGFAYLAACKYAHEDARSGHWRNNLAIFFTILSYVGFLVGCVAACIFFRREFS